MKFKIIFSMVLLLTVSFSYASFPVNRTVKTVVNERVNVDSDIVSDLTSPAATSAKRKDLTVALLLCLFAGGLAAHRWYLGSPVGWNILFIVTAGGLLVWWIIDLFDIVFEKYPGL